MNNMKRVSLLLIVLLGTFTVLSAHDAHVGVMNVELGLKLAEGKDVMIKYRALNLGSGQTWEGLKSGQIARPFPIAEMTTSVDLKVGGNTVAAGTHRLFFVGGEGGMSLQIGGSRQEPGPRVPINVTAAPSRAEHLIIGATHGDGSTDFVIFMVYGDSLGGVVFDTN
jgi:hypothetical protein